MNDKHTLNQKNKWYQRKYIKVLFALLLISVLYRVLIPKNKKAENKLDIGGPIVELQPYNDTTKVKTNTSQTTAVESSIEEVSVNDSTVIRAYRDNNWQIIPTTQAEPHTISYDEESNDRLEIRQAISQATAIPADQLEEWWIGAAGEHAVTATVSKLATEQAYRVSLEWQQNKGWQVTLIEELNSLPSFQ